MVADVMLVVIAMLLGGLVKATLGFGAPVVAIPILALGLTGEDAVLLMALPGVVANGMLTWTTRAGRHDAVDLWPIVLPSIPAAAIGALALTELPERAVSLLLAAMLVAYLIQHRFRPDATVGPAARRWLSPAVGFGGGLSQGAVGISLPWIGPYLNGLRLAPEAFVHEICVFFLVPTVVQMITFVFAGEYDGRRIVLSLVGAAVYLLTIVPGARVRRAMTVSTFEIAVLGMLAVAAIALSLQALV